MDDDEEEYGPVYCSEGCGRVLWPHEGPWCDVCGGSYPADERPDVGTTTGVVGAFVMPPFASKSDDHKPQTQVKP